MPKVSVSAARPACPPRKLTWLAGFLLVSMGSLLVSINSAWAQDVSFGQRLFQDKADCKFCHGPDGDGRGDPRSPGAAANLRRTILDRKQIIEIVACGRPATEMPHFDKYAYEDDTPCFGMRDQDIGKDKPPDPHSTPLTRREIEAVTDYILTTFVGK